MTILELFDVPSTEVLAGKLGEVPGLCPPLEVREYCFWYDTCADCWKSVLDKVKEVVISEPESENH